MAKIGENTIYNDFIQDILKRKLKVPKFLGVFPCDLMPNQLQNGEKIIINTGKSDTPGKHFVVLHKKKSGYFLFDSLNMGLKNQPDLLASLREKKITPQIVQKRPIQSVFSNSCGLYVIDYILANTRPYSRASGVKKYKRSDKMLLENDFVAKNNVINRMLSK